MTDDREWARAARRRHPWLRRIGLVGIALVSLVAVWVLAGAIVYTPEYVVRVLAWRESDIGDYLDGFPNRRLAASATPSAFAGDPDEAAVRAAFEEAFGVPDLDAFLADSGSQAFIVIKDDAVVYEHYFNGTTRDSMLTSFSVAKSFVSVLVGIAIDEGRIGGVDDPITTYLPELLDRDEAFGDITIRDLLAMAGGLDYHEMGWWFFNGDDPLTTYHPDQRGLALTNTSIIDPPGGYFLYNKYFPQLLGMILERTTGVSVTEYTQTRLWDPLGMEFDGAWALDSIESGFEKMEAGLNARAIDFAKLGRLVLRDGEGDGGRIVSSEWVTESTALDERTHTGEYYAESFGPAVYNDGAGYYGYMWYGKLRPGAPSDVAAGGDHGQFVYVSPAHDVIIVRNGAAYGDLPFFGWIDAFYDAAPNI